jgi:hypothetical protein
MRDLPQLKSAMRRCYEADDGGLSLPSLSFVLHLQRRRLPNGPSNPLDRANILHCALELSKKSWLLAIQFPDREQPSVYPIARGNTDKLIATLTAAIECLVIDPGSLQVSRRGRRVKTGRVDVQDTAAYADRLVSGRAACLVAGANSKYQGGGFAALAP